MFRCWMHDEFEKPYFLCPTCATKAIRIVQWLLQAKGRDDLQILGATREALLFLNSALEADETWMKEFIAASNLPPFQD